MLYLSYHIFHNRNNTNLSILPFSSLELKIASKLYLLYLFYNNS